LANRSATLHPSPRLDEARARAHLLHSGPTIDRLTSPGDSNMKRIKNLSMIFALVCSAVATGCAADPADVEPEGDGGGDDGGGGDVEQPRPLDAAGTYKLQSKFDIVSEIPGTAGTVINTMIAITDDPDDPTLWVLDQLIGAMPSGWIKSALQNAKPYV